MTNRFQRYTVEVIVCHEDREEAQNILDHAGDLLEPLQMKAAREQQKLGQELGRGEKTKPLT